MADRSVDSKDSPPSCSFSRLIKELGPIHCCRQKCFPVCPRAQHLLRTQILCPGTKNVSDFVQKHFVSATNVSQFGQPKKHHGQQCVPSFTRALPGRNAKWNRKFREFPNFQKEQTTSFPETFCSIRFWTGISGIFDRFSPLHYGIGLGHQPVSKTRENPRKRLVAATQGNFFQKEI